MNLDPIEHELQELEQEEQIFFFIEFLNEYYQFSGLYDKDDRDMIMYKYIVKKKTRRRGRSGTPPNRTLISPSVSPSTSPSQISRY